MATQNDDKAPLGSVPVNPLPEPTIPPVPPASPAPSGDEPPKDTPDTRIAELEKRLADREKTVGRQGSELGALRKEIESLKNPPKPAGPSEDEQLATILGQIESGDLELQSGLKQALALNSQLTAKQVMNELGRRSQEEAFLKANPDFGELRDSGALQSYLDADPFADEYVAYKQFKADERIRTLEEEKAAAIAAAKEEGAKLAQGAAEAGKVLGKTGQAARAAATVPAKPFANSREASEAMMAKLREMRGSK